MKNDPSPLTPEACAALCLARARELVEAHNMAKHVETVRKYEGLFTSTQAGRILGVSKQRVHQLVKAKRLPVVEVVYGSDQGGLMAAEEYIPGGALRLFMAKPRPHGRHIGEQVAQMELQAA